MMTAFRRSLLIWVIVFAANVSSGAIHQSKDPAAEQGNSMEITIFARFHAIEGKGEAVASELRDTVKRVRPEPGCLGIEVYRSVRDPRLFFLHSRWVDEAAFDRHVQLPATNAFVERMQRLIDHPFDVNRTRLLR